MSLNYSGTELLKGIKHTEEKINYQLIKDVKFSGIDSKTWASANDYSGNQLIRLITVWSVCRSIALTSFRRSSSAASEWHKCCGFPAWSHDLCVSPAVWLWSLTNTPSQLKNSELIECPWATHQIPTSSRRWPPAHFNLFFFLKVSGHQRP